MKRVLFVCLGNIIRSPLAEHLFRQQIEREGRSSEYQADSAGTAAWHVGEAPDPRMRKTAEGHGLSYTGQARQVEPQDFEDFDLIIAMDSSNFKNLLELTQSDGQRAKVRLMREFDSQADEMDVPDPYYGGSEGFENTFEIVRRSVEGLVAALEHGDV
jgi:protein-tyrosine phosphatase